MKLRCLIGFHDIYKLRYCNMGHQSYRVRSDSHTIQAYDYGLYGRYYTANLPDWLKEKYCNKLAYP